MLLKKLTRLYYLSFLLLSKSDYITKDTKYVNISFYKEVIPKVSNDLTLIIPVINLEVTTSYTSTLKEGLQIHELSTKPSDENSTVIIMGHAGIGQNVYFNNLKNLKENDEINIEYSNNIYNYIIENKEMIIKGNSYNFEFNQDYLYLITCYHHDKQIVIRAKMAKN